LGSKHFERVFRKFPFLIGRIKREDISFLDTGIEVFPFLIGRIKSRCNWKLPLANMVFPFLIGRIKRVGK